MIGLWSNKTLATNLDLLRALHVAAAWITVDTMSRTWKVQKLTGKWSYTTIQLWIGFLLFRSDMFFLTCHDIWATSRRFARRPAPPQTPRAKSAQEKGYQAKQLKRHGVVITHGPTNHQQTRKGGLKRAESTWSQIGCKLRYIFVIDDYARRVTPPYPMNTPGHHSTSELPHQEFSFACSVRRLHAPDVASQGLGDAFWCRHGGCLLV